MLSLLFLAVGGCFFVFFGGGDLTGTGPLLLQHHWVHTPIIYHKETTMYILLQLLLTLIWYSMEHKWPNKHSKVSSQIKKQLLYYTSEQGNDEVAHTNRAYRTMEATCLSIWPPWFLARLLLLQGNCTSASAGSTASWLLLKLCLVLLRCLSYSGPVAKFLAP